MNAPPRAATSCASSSRRCSSASPTCCSSTSRRTTSTSSRSAGSSRSSSTSSPGTLVVVSHDRHFLNAVATHIADVDYQTITVYTGNYDDFVDAKYENKQRAARSAQAAKKKIAELQDFVQRFGSHASKSKQAQTRVKQIEKLEEAIETKGAKRSSLVRPFIRFEFDKPSGRDVAPHRERRARPSATSKRWSSTSSVAST